MNTTKGCSSSLLTTYINRAYWAINSVQNGVFIKQAGETFVLPNREDEIVAMLTSQNSEEVALLRLTRELIDKAEKEQPEKKLGIVKQSNYAMVIEPTSEQGQERPKEKCCQTTRIEETQKAEQSQTSMKQSEEKNQYKVKTQEVSKESQQEKAVKVSIENSI